MKKLRSGLFALSLMTALSSTHALPGTLTIGTPIAVKEITLLTTSDPVAFSSQKYRVVDIRKAQKAGVNLPEAVRSGTSTMVINRNGIAGVSKHEVVISGASEDELRSAVHELKLKPGNIKVMSQVKTIVLVFPKFAEAIAAQGALSEALPDAKVGLPVQFQRPRAQ